MKKRRKKNSLANPGVWVLNEPQNPVATIRDTEDKEKAEISCAPRRRYRLNDEENARGLRGTRETGIEDERERDRERERERYRKRGCDAPVASAPFLVEKNFHRGLWVIREFFFMRT